MIMCPTRMSDARTAIFTAAAAGPTWSFRSFPRRRQRTAADTTDLVCNIVVVALCIINLLMYRSSVQLIATITRLAAACIYAVLTDARVIVHRVRLEIPENLRYAN